MEKILIIAAILITFAATNANGTNLSKSAFATGALSISSAMEASWLSDWISRHCTNCGGWL
jgi:hypothetical protein